MNNKLFVPLQNALKESNRKSPIKLPKYPLPLQYMDWMFAIK